MIYLTILYKSYIKQLHSTNKISAINFLNSNTSNTRSFVYRCSHLYLRHYSFTTSKCLCCFKLLYGQPFHFFLMHLSFFFIKSAIFIFSNLSPIIKAQEISQWNKHYNTTRNKIVSCETFFHTNLSTYSKTNQHTTNPYHYNHSPSKDFS